LRKASHRLLVMPTDLGAIAEQPSVDMRTVHLINGLQVETKLPGDCRIIRLTIRGDEFGKLIAIEETTDVPFAIARVYYIYGTQAGIVRGKHAHRQLQQLVVPLSGSCTMTLDDGENRVALSLDNPAHGLTLPPMVWHEMSDFSSDCVLMTLADAAYDERDYIRDYGDFRALCRTSL
jgi:dTDP-4-dehydrorhamnose 3,5-epimerase